MKNKNKRNVFRGGKNLLAGRPYATLLSRYVTFRLMVKKYIWDSSKNAGIDSILHTEFNLELNFSCWKWSITYCKKNKR